MPRKVIERGEQANQARDAAMAAAGMEAEETTAIDFYLDRLKTDITESPGRVFDVATNFVAAVPGLLGDAQRVFNPKTGAPEGVRKLPTSSDIAEDMGASGEGYGAILGQLLSPLSPADVKLALGAGGALLGYMKMAGQGKRLPRALEAMRGGPAYHGTPHKFDQFDLEKIGTGEGAQAYGHGLYFAESPGVAKSYQTNVTGVRRPMRADTVEKLVEQEGSETAAREYLQRRLNENIKSQNFSQIDNYKEQMSILDSGSYKGHLYEVDLPDETIAKMLDWDAPLSEQLDVIGDLKLPVDNELTGATAREVDLVFDNAIRQAKAGDSGVTGETLYELMSRSVGERRASALLNEAGIPGIRYYDAASRGYKGQQINLKGIGKSERGYKVRASLGNQKLESPYFDTEAEAQKWLKDKHDELVGGTRNIVVFNPDDIKSVKRDGELVFTKPTTSGPK